jgi:hypothetical protein
MARRSPSDLVKRVAKYDAKVNGANVTTVLTAVKPYMVQEANYQFEEQFLVERKVKMWFAGAALDTILLSGFMACGKAAGRIIRKHVGLTMIDELTNLCDLFLVRGLALVNTKAMILSVYGVTVP